MVSVIVPIYNVEKYIEVSLRSLMNQSYKDIEIVLVNDCTPDKSMEIIKQILFDSKYPTERVKILNLSENGGLSNARNQGLLVAQGEFIFFMDSDDCITKDCIESHIKIIEKYNLDFTDGNVNIIGTSHNMFDKYEQINIISGEKVLPSYFKYLHICGWNKLVRKDFIINNSIFFKKGMLYEDMLWCYQLCRKANSYAQIPSITYLYLLRSGSITTQNNNSSHAKKQFASFVELFKLMIDEFHNSQDKELKKMQYSWMGKKLIIVKSRLLMAPLNKTEKVQFFNQLKDYNFNTSGILKVVNKLNYIGFSLIFYIPNYIFRFLRKYL